ncbi:MAG: cellulose biosynthesis cyclic di-GMP-binding regulatory protein BcsB [Anaerolineae bacterium]|nr:cellulose biosynthesis cyclic di-GMP-binding regulatory protein BcsB [Anaerolineae bacterium]
MNRSNRMYYRPFGLSVLVIAGITLALLLSGAKGVEASTGPAPVQQVTTPTPTPLPVGAPTGTLSLPLSRFGITDDIVLRSPSAVTEVNFELPYRWLLADGIDHSYVELRYDVTGSAGSPLMASPQNDMIPGSLLEVFFDDYLLASITPQYGTNQILRLPIPVGQVNPNRESSFHTLRVSYYSGRDCDLANEVRVAVKNNSIVRVAYTEVPIVPDLGDFPRPLTQNPYIPQSAAIVIPEDFTESDLSAAASIAATLGRLTFGALRVELMTTAEANPTALGDRSVVLVGEPDRHGLIDSLYRQGLMPTTLTPEGDIKLPSGLSAQPDDGILQEIVRPTSPSHVFLIVSGNTPEGVTKAAHALLQPQPAFGFNGALVVVESINSVVTEEVPVQEVTTLEDVGFTDAIFYGTGSQRSSASFFVPANWQILSGAAITLEYAYSNSLDTELSGVTVELNGRPVGSAPIVADATGVQRAVVELPASEFRPGERNRISFEMYSQLPAECVPPGSRAAWVRVLGSSSLNLPHSLIEERTEVGLRGGLFAPFVSRLDLSDVWLILPEEPTSAQLHGLGQFASVLGQSSGGDSLNVRASRVVSTDLDVYSDYNVVLFGRPSTNPLIAAVNDLLPQPFEVADDTLEPGIGTLTYRLPEGFSVGVIEIIPAPWDSNRLVGVITGTTEQGETWSMDALADDELRYQVVGNLTFVRETEVESLNTGITVGEGVVNAIEAAAGTPGAGLALTPIVTPTLAPVTPGGPLPPEYEGGEDSGLSTTVYILVAALVGVGLVIAVGGVWLTWKRSKN